MPSGNNQVSIIVGNCNGSCAVTVNGLNSLSLGSTVTVKVEQTASLGRTVASSGLSTLSTTTYTPSNGTISIPITMATNNAYRLTVIPGSGCVGRVKRGRIKTATRSAGDAPGRPFDRVSDCRLDAAISASDPDD